MKTRRKAHRGPRIAARPGLTLPEVLVTLAIIAVIAAVMIPALTGQLVKGDAGRVAEDLKAVQTGIGAFVSDVRRYPRTANQLTVRITATAAPCASDRLGCGLDAGGIAFTTAQVNRWRGPYVVKSIPSTATDFVTGFDGVVSGTFTSATIDASAYVRIALTGLDQTQLDRVDSAVDDGVSTTGLFRTESGVGAFYALPIQ